MLEMEQELEGSPVSMFIFWKPPYDYKIPQSPPGHVYIPLKHGCMKAIYNPVPFSSYNALFECITQENYKKTTDSANLLMISPHRKLSIIRAILFVLIFQSILRMIGAIFAGDYISFAIFCVFLIYSPILMRYGCGQHLNRMKKYEKALNKSIANQNTSEGSSSSIVVTAGKMCLWLDFHIVNCEPGIELELELTENFYNEQRAEIIL